MLDLDWVDSEAFRAGGSGILGSMTWAGGPSDDLTSYLRYFYLSEVLLFNTSDLR